MERRLYSTEVGTLGGGLLVDRPASSRVPSRPKRRAENSRTSHRPQQAPIPGASATVTDAARGTTVSARQPRKACSRSTICSPDLLGHGRVAWFEEAHRDAEPI